MTVWTRSPPAVPAECGGVAALFCFILATQAYPLSAHSDRRPVTEGDRHLRTQVHQAACRENERWNYYGPFGM
jgi:hypothetical protein